MYRTLYETYKKQVFVLAKTLVVKHDEIATSINHELFWSGHYNEVHNADPNTWRYYMNLAGEYHQYDIDYLLEKYGKPYMTVQIPAVDGVKEVPFTRDLFNGDDIDISLANEFTMGSKLYNDIVDRYPPLEALINGIINPIDKDIAINARNGEILHIDGFYKTIDPETGRRYFTTRINKNHNVLIEEQEHNLIDGIQDFIYNYLDHWVNAEYIYGNDLYTITTIGQLYTHLPNVIMSIRLGNCRTTYAHSFHIKLYLESFGKLGRYVDYIPLVSSLWLYRNTMYYEANRGKHLTFDAIIRNLWTPNKIPINAYSIRHNLATMGGENLLPNGMLYKEVLNFAIPGISDHDRTVRDILEDQIPLARENHKDLDYKEAKIQEVINWGGDDRLQTKVLESEMMNMGEPYPFDLDTMLLNHWGYTAHKGYYTGTVYFTHPISNDRMGLTPLNAYLLTVYCLNLAVADNKLVDIPYIHFYDIPRTNNPADYPTEQIFLPKPSLDKAYSWVDHSRTRRRKVEEVLGRHTPKFIAKNANTFFKNTEEIYAERVRQYHAYSNTEDFKERGDLHLVNSRMYWQGFKEKLANGTYEEWLRTLGINFEGFEKTDYLKLGLELIKQATGIDSNKNDKKKWLQKSMIAILKHFISYTVHLIDKFADGVVTYLGMQTVRYSNFKWTFNGMAAHRWQLYLDYDARLKVKLPVSTQMPSVFDDDRFKLSMKPEVAVIYDTGDFRIKLGKNRHHIGLYNLDTSVFNIRFNNKDDNITYREFPPPPPDEYIYRYDYIKSETYPLVVDPSDNNMSLQAKGIVVDVTPSVENYDLVNIDSLNVNVVPTNIDVSIRKQITNYDFNSSNLDKDVVGLKVVADSTQFNVVKSITHHDLQNAETTNLRIIPESFEVSFASPPPKFAIRDELMAGRVGLDVIGIIRSPNKFVDIKDKVMAGNISITATAKDDSPNIVIDAENIANVDNNRPTDAVVAGKVDLGVTAVVNTPSIRIDIVDEN